MWIRTRFWRYQPGNDRHVVFIPVPGLGRDVHGCAELVVPGRVQELDDVVTVSAVIDAIRAEINIVAHVGSRIAHTGD